MTSHFLALHRSDAAACSRAFEKVAQGRSTIKNSELPNFFLAIGAVTAPEIVDSIIAQHTSTPSSPDHVSREECMNFYSIWLRMVSVNEPPSIGLMDQGTVVTEDSHWVDKFGAYLGNTRVTLLKLLRSLCVMIFTLVHWFSVCFRDADPSLRCGSVGIGLDAGLTALLALDLFVEYHVSDARCEVKHAIEAQEQKKMQELLVERTRRDSVLSDVVGEGSGRVSLTGSLSGGASPVALSGWGSPTLTGSRTGAMMMMGSPASIGNLDASFAGSGGGATAASASATNLNAADLNSVNEDAELPFFDKLWIFASIFFSRKKNILALIALLPIDLFLCGGDEATAATVLNHFRVICVFRNFFDVTPPAPVPLTPFFADAYYMWMPLWMMTYVFIFISSAFALIFIIFRNNNTHPEASSVDFLTAFYFIVQTFTTVGYGDISLVGTAETWFAVVLVLIGMITNATVIGSLVALIQLGNATLVRSDRIRETHAVLHYFSIPRLLQLEILGFQEHVLFSDVISAFHTDTESYPTAMKDAMILKHRLDVLQQIHPFELASPDELFFFAKELGTACYKPEEYLSCCSEPHHGVRILLFGLVDRLDSRGRYIKTLRSGDCFGLESVLTGRDEEFNHKALAYCDLLVISYDDFHNLLDAMPKLRSWMVPALRHMEKMYDINAADGGGGGGGDENTSNEEGGCSGKGQHNSTSKVLRSPVSMIDTTGGNLSMVHDLRSELRVLRRGLQTLAMAPALNK